MHMHCYTCLMTNEQKRGPGGSKPKRGAAATQSLGSVRVTDDELQAYSDAAEATGKSRADWIRDTLQRAARRVLSSKG